MTSSTKWSGTSALIAYDTETHLIADRKRLLIGTQRINLEPWVPPKLVLGTRYDGWAASLLAPEELVAAVEADLEQGRHVVFHNVRFDLSVLTAYAPHLQPLFNAALEEGRIHDTMYLDLLSRLASGYFDNPIPSNNWAPPRLQMRSLKDLARYYLGEELDKDDEVRLNFAQYDGQVHRMPERFRQYAMKDAVVTWQIATKLLSQAPADLWGEAGQLRAEVALLDMDGRGCRIDTKEALRLKEIFERDLVPLQQTLVEHGLAEWKPRPRSTHLLNKQPRSTLPQDLLDFATSVNRQWRRTGSVLRRLTLLKTELKVEAATPQFHFSTKALRARLERFAEEQLLELSQLPRTEKTKELQTNAEDWADLIPAEAVDLLAWCDYAKLQKILGTYLNLYSQVERVYPKWICLGARSGRMSCASPNAQNISKRTHGIRSLFIPDEGKVFVKADYSTQELFTLAEYMLEQGIDGPLAAALRSGGDIHRLTAASMAGVAPEAVTKEQRQAAKALNFGLPGGLGWRKLQLYTRKTYGIALTDEEAKEARDRFFAVYPDVAQYLDSLKTGLDADLRRASGQGLLWWKSFFGVVTAWDVRRKFRETRDDRLREVWARTIRGLNVRLPSGRVRGCCTYTEGANCAFQGTASDVTKEAAWLAYRRGIEVVLVVHDELVAQTVPEAVPQLTKQLEGCMLEAFKRVCPRMGPYARVECSGALDAWGKATDGSGKEI